MNAVFMVESIMAVSGPARPRREKGEQNDSEKRNDKGMTFSEVMSSMKSSAVETLQSSKQAPSEYRSTWYGRDMQLSFTNYRTREYHY
jgi:hypothetical protein